jgi:hypothetical protein
MNYEASGTGTSAGFARQQTMIVSEAFLSPGTHIITALVDVGGPRPGFM